MMKKQWNTVLLIALVLLVVIFAVLNVDPVNINFGFTTVAIPLVIVIIGTLLIGVLIAVIWSTSIVFSERNKQKKLQKQIDHFEQEAAQEKETINKQHQTETQALKNEIDERKNKIRELERRIQNMQTSQQAKNHDSLDI
jgi:uncharacterized integral membrane protein